MLCFLACRNIEFFLTYVVVSGIIKLAILDEFYIYLSE